MKVCERVCVCVCARVSVSYSGKRLSRSSPRLKLSRLKKNAVLVGSVRSKLKAMETYMSPSIAAIFIDMPMGRTAGASWMVKDIVNGNTNVKEDMISKGFRQQHIIETPSSSGSSAVSQSSIDSIRGHSPPTASSNTPLRPLLVTSIPFKIAKPFMFQLKH